MITKEDIGREYIPKCSSNRWINWEMVTPVNRGFIFDFVAEDRKPVKVNLNGRDISLYTNGRVYKSKEHNADFFEWHYLKVDLTK